MTDKRKTASQANGYATAASLHEATGLAVVVAFDANEASLEKAVTQLCVAVYPWANEMLGLDLQDTRYMVEETLCQLQAVLVEHGRCDLPYLGLIERTSGDSEPGWRFTPDLYALGLLPPSSAAAQLMG